MGGTPVRQSGRPIRGQQPQWLGGGDRNYGNGRCDVPAMVAVDGEATAATRASSRLETSPVLRPSEAQSSVGPRERGGGGRCQAEHRQTSAGTWAAVRSGCPGRRKLTVCAGAIRGKGSSLPLVFLLTLKWREELLSAAAPWFSAEMAEWPPKRDATKSGDVKADRKGQNVSVRNGHDNLDSDRWTANLWQCP